ncbi:hypothetical protein M8J76_010862 [Diaphorina citri]|nr:hypothetical protein M8J76_010862 [Diaphorina citri]
MSWYSNVLKEIDGYNDHWRSKLVESWTETEVYNWIASSSRLTLVPLEELPFEQFRHVTGKQLVKWKVSNFVHKDAKNGVFLYLYLQDIIAHHKGKACRNNLVPAVVGITSQVEPAVKDELEDGNIRVADSPILHTNTWRKKNLSDWTGLDVYHWLLHLCKEHHIPLDKFPFTEFEDFDGMRLLLLSGNDYAKKSADYGIFIYQSVNQLILHYSDANLNSSSLPPDHNEDEFATIFTSNSNTSVTDTHPTSHHAHHQNYHDSHHSSSNYYLNPTPSYNNFSSSTNLPLSHDSPPATYTPLHDKTSPGKPEPHYTLPHAGYQYVHPIKYEPNLDITSNYSYPSQNYCNYHPPPHERTSTLTNMDSPGDYVPHDRNRTLASSDNKISYGHPIKLEPDTSHQYATRTDEYASSYPSPSPQRRKPPTPPPPTTHHVPYPYYPSYPQSVHPVSRGYYETSPNKDVTKHKSDPNPIPRTKTIPPPPPLHHIDLYRKLTPRDNDLSAPTCHEREPDDRGDPRAKPQTNKPRDSTPDGRAAKAKDTTPVPPHQSSEKKSPVKKKSAGTPEKKKPSTDPVSKPTGIPYSVLTAYKDSTKITIKFADTSGTYSWRGKSIKLWTSTDVRNWFRTISPDIGLPASKFPLHMFPEDLDGPKLLEMKKSDFIKKYQKLGENLYGKLEELIVTESCYDSGSGSDGSKTSGTSDDNRDQSYPSSADNSDSDEDPLAPDPVPQPSTSTAPDVTPTRRKPGRPKGVTNRNSRKKEKLGKVWQFLISLLHNPDYNPSLICWENYEEGKFRFVQSDKVAGLWGDTKHNETYNYEKFSRAMRYYYKHDILRSVDGRLIYQFGANAVGWRTENPIDPGERISLNTSLSRSNRHLSPDTGH